MSEEENQGIALSKYQTILGYLQYENTVFWTRSGFVLIAQTALLGFYVTMLPRAEKPTAGIALQLGCLGVIGLLLVALWFFAIASGTWWINRWRDILGELEEPAWGKRNILREANPPWGARFAATYVAALFGVIWLVGVAGAGGVLYLADESASACRSEMRQK
jgi:hypothetical protein